MLFKSQTDVNKVARRMRESRRNAVASLLIFHSCEFAGNSKLCRKVAFFLLPDNQIKRLSEIILAIKFYKSPLMICLDCKFL